MFMELMDTYLGKLLKRMKPNPFPEEIIGKIVVAVVKAVEYLRTEFFVVHRGLHVCVLVSVCVCVYVCLYACLYLCVYMCLYACFFICQSVCFLSTCLTVYVFVYLSIFVLICMSLHFN